MLEGECARLKPNHHFFLLKNSINHQHYHHHHHHRHQGREETHLHIGIGLLEMYAKTKHKQITSSRLKNSVQLPVDKGSDPDEAAY